MIYAVHLAPDVEGILVDAFQAYFQKEAKTSDLFRNYPTIRVSQTHPFAHLVDQVINGTQVVLEGLFPSLTVISESDNKAIPLPPLIEEASFGLPEIQHILDHRELYIVSDATIAALQALVGEDDAATRLFARQTVTVRGHSISLEVWADNADLKNKIYDLAQAFVMGPKRFDLKNESFLELRESEMSGQRSGQYNFDFGKIFYGGSIRIPVDITYMQLFIDSDQSEITGVEVHTNGV